MRSHVSRLWGAVSFIAVLLTVIQLPAQAAVGRTAGTFNVSSTGAATYTIPIWVPPGTKGIQPKLTLGYNSQADGQSDGDVVGIGWHLNGLSAITRCSQTIGQDQYPYGVLLTMTDKFCLDGSRLRLTTVGGTYGNTGTTYQTEIANFSQITAYGTAGNGPAYFQVQGKDGLIYEYGNSNDSRITPTYPATTVATPYQWLLNKVRDRAGNYYAVTYGVGAAGSAGIAVPTSIVYTPVAAGSTTYTYTVSFSYTTRVSQNASTTLKSLIGYVAGTQTTNTNLLSSITIKNSTAIVHQYNLLYDSTGVTTRARLASVTECGGSNGTLDCLPATTMTYTNTGIGVTDALPTPVTGNVTVIATGDFNGDKRADILYKDVATSTLYVMFANSATPGFLPPISLGVTCINCGPWRTQGALTFAAGTVDYGIGYGDLTASGQQDILVPVSGLLWRYRWDSNSNTFVSSNTNISAVDQALLVDVNGDGLPDLVTRSANTVYIRLNTSVNGVLSFSPTNTLAYTYTGTNTLLWISVNALNSGLKGFDYNGDGRPDVMFQGMNGVAGYYANVGYQFVPHAVDANILLYNNTTFTATQLFNKPDIGSTYYYAYVMANANNDRCTDLLTFDEVYVSDSHEYISACNGTAATIATPNANFYLGAMDWDGDGRTDFLVSNGDYRSGTATLGVLLSTGDGTSSLLSTAIPATGVNVFPLDVDGDGKTDLGTWGTTGITYRLHATLSAQPDVLSNVTDSYGVSISPSYVPIAQSNYTKASGLAPSEKEYSDSLYVVSSVVMPDGTGGTYSQTYNYTGAVADIQRGFEGFQSVTKSDSRAGAPQVKTYYQTVFPYTGIVQQQDIYQHDGTSLISHTVNTTPTALSDITLDSTAYNQRYFPYITNTTTQQYEVSGSNPLITTTSTDYVYDATNKPYGNATTITTTITDNDPGSPFRTQQWVTKTVNTVSPNASTWCIALPSETDVTQSTTYNSEPSVARTVTYSVDSNKCRVTQQTVAPGSPYQLTTTYGFDDDAGNPQPDFGNITSITVTGASLSANIPSTRTTSIVWADASRTTGQFPIQVTNAAGEVTNLDYYYDQGLKKSQTDANNLTTTWQYDNFGREVTEVRPDGTNTHLTYWDCANFIGCVAAGDKLVVTRVDDDANNVGISSETTHYDQFERPLESHRSLLSSMVARNEVRYDSLGRVLQRAIPCTFTGVSTPCSYWTTYTYDALNRVLTATRPTSAGDSTPQSTTYSYAGRTTTVTDAMTHSTTQIQDVNGWLRRSQDANNYSQSFGYDAYGSLKSVTDSQSNLLFTALYAYGAQPFQTGTTDIDLGSWGYVPNAFGEVVTYTDNKLVSFGAEYDAMSRQTKRTETEGTTIWSWGTNPALHEVGQLHSVSSTTGPTENYLYDGYGRLSQRQIALGTTYYYDYTYNTSGLVDTLTYPASGSGYRLKLQYLYSAGTGILQQVKDANASTIFWQANTMNPRGQITQATLGNGIVVNRFYDAVTGWLSNIQCGIGGGACSQNQSYLYDKVGNVTQRQNNNLGLTENFTYDAVNRLDNSQLNGVTNFDPSYDVLGNITARSDVSNGIAWVYDSVHKHQVVQAGSNTYSYDANGNVQSRNGNTISWTSYNYPYQIAGNGETLNLSYDANRQRYQQIYTANGVTETTQYIGGLLEKVSVNGVDDYRYTIAANGETIAIVSSKSGNNVTHYLLNDHQGSVAKITNSDGSEYVSESFSAFGSRRNPQTWSGNATYGDQTNSSAISRDGYTGQTALGNLGLIHMNGRVEDAITGRFLSADPYITEPDNTQNYNRYSYVRNNPLSLVDPSGFYWLEYDSCVDIVKTSWVPITLDGQTVYGPTVEDNRFCYRDKIWVDPPSNPAAGAARSSIVASPPQTQNQKPDDPCKMASQQRAAASTAQKDGWNGVADYASAWSAFGEWGSSAGGNSTAADQRSMGNMGRFFSWVARAASLFSIKEQPDQLTKSFAATDAAIGEALSAGYGPVGTAASVAYSKAGGTQALSLTQAAAANAQILATANYLCMFSGGK